MEERVSSTSPRRNTGVMNKTKGHFTQRNEVRNSIRRMKYMYLELAFYSNSVYISGNPLYAERGIVQLNASPECTAGYAMYPLELTNLICEFWDLIRFRIAGIWVKVT